MRRESALQKKRIEEQQLEEKSKKIKQPSESSDSEDEAGDSSQTTSSMPNGVKNGEQSLNGFFRRQSVAIIAPLSDSKVPYPDGSMPKDAHESTVSLAGPCAAYKIPEINEPTLIEVPKSNRRESVVVFKDNLAAALQMHMQNLRGDSNASSRRPSTVDGMLSLNVDSCGSSISNSRRTSAVDSPAFPHGSSISSRANSRRPSAVNAQEIRPLPDYESLKFVPGMTGFDDSLEPPRYAAVIGRSRRESLDSQFGFQGNPILSGDRGTGKTTFEMSKMESSTDPTPESDYLSNDFLPAIPESPHPPQKRFF